MFKKGFNLIWVVIVGAISSSVAWGLTVNWKISIMAFGLFAIACVILSIVPFAITAFSLRFNKSGIQRVYANQYEAESYIQENLLPHAREIDVLTVRGLGVFALKDSLLRKQILERNHTLKVRLLLLDPSSQNCGKRAAEIGEDTAYFIETLKTAIGAVKELKRLQATNLEGRLYSGLPIWRLIRVDDCLFVSSFLPAQEGHSSTMYRIRKGAAMSLFPTFMRYFDELWNLHEKNVIN